MVDLNGKKILIAFLGRLSNLISTTPFIRALKNAAPAAKLVFLADEKYKDIVLNNPCLDEVITIDKNGRDNSLLALTACGRYLSSLDFDVIINLQPTERCSYICSITKTKFRTGTSHGLFKLFWNEHFALNKKLHTVEMYLDILHKLGVNNIEHQGLEVFPTEKDAIEAETFWREFGVFSSDKLVAYHVGSSLKEKRWHSAKFGQVAEELTKDGYRAVFFGGTYDEELVQIAVNQMQSTPILATGQFTLGSLAKAIERCDLIIANDSGPLQIAISRDVPAIGIYGTDNEELARPYGKNARAIRADGINSIAIENVLSVAREMLALNQTKAREE